MAHVVMVVRTISAPGSTYTIGLSHTHNAPALARFGPDSAPHAQHARRQALPGAGSLARACGLRPGITVSGRVMDALVCVFAGHP